MTRPVPRRIRQQVIAEQRFEDQFLCGYCSRPLREDRPKSVHIDHVIPRMTAEWFPFLFGAEELEESWNLSAVCRCCNEDKHVRRGAGPLATWPPAECAFWLDFSVAQDKLTAAGDRWFGRLRRWVTTATPEDLEHLCLRASVEARLTRAIVESAAAAAGERS